MKYESISKYELPPKSLENSVLKVCLIGSSISFIEKPVTPEILNKVRKIVDSYTPVELAIIRNELKDNGVPKIHIYLDIPHNYYNEICELLTDEKNT